MQTTTPKDAVLTLRLTPKMKATLETRARERNRSLSEVIRETILAVADACPTCGRPYHHRASHAAVETAAE